MRPFLQFNMQTTPFLATLIGFLRLIINSKKRDFEKKRQ